MLSKRENVFRDYAVDCGFYFEKIEGLFNKSDRRRGMVGFDRAFGLDLNDSD